MNESQQKSALSGVRILDFTAHAAGPQATLLLAYLGAEVIKVESSLYMDTLRREAAQAMGSKRAGLSWFNPLNANKQSITLNLKTAEGIKIAKKLARISDVAVDNFRAGVMDKLGLGYSALKEIKPDIIQVSSSSHGANGPESDYSGFAVTMGPLSGLSHLTGYAGGPPTILRHSMDLRAGTATTFAILAALIHRRHTGKGQFVDLSQREALSCGAAESIMDYTMNNKVRSRNGNRDENMAPHNCYRCQGEDKWISIAISTDEEWQALCQATGHPEWAKIDKFHNQLSRWQNQEELDKLIEGWTSSHTHYEVMEILQNASVAAMPSLSNEELFHNPHLKERETFAQVQHPEEGELLVLAPSWKLSRTPGQVHQAAPLLGQHTEHIFRELLGMSQDDIAVLVKDKVIY